MLCRLWWNQKKKHVVRRSRFRVKSKYLSITTTKLDLTPFWDTSITSKSGRWSIILDLRRLGRCEENRRDDGEYIFKTVSAGLVVSSWRETKNEKPKTNPIQSVNQPTAGKSNIVRVTLSSAESRTVLHPLPTHTQTHTRDLKNIIVSRRNSDDNIQNGLKTTTIIIIDEDNNNRY